MKLDEIKNWLKKEVGLDEETFAYLGDHSTYREHVRFQHAALDNASDDELKYLYAFVRGLRKLRPRHIDFYISKEQYVITGVYYHISGRIMTYSGP